MTGSNRDILDAAKAVAGEPETRRERLAGMAMAGLLAGMPEEGEDIDIVARWAVRHADALIAELDKGTDAQPDAKDAPAPTAAPWITLYSEGEADD